MNLKKVRLSARAFLVALCSVAVFCSVIGRCTSEQSIACAGIAEQLLPDFDLQAVEAVLSTEDDVFDELSLDIKAQPIISSNQSDARDYKDIKLIPGGVPFGVKLYSDGVTVLGVGEVKCDNGTFSPAKDAGIVSKDVILKINGKSVSTAEDVVAQIHSCEGSTLSMTVIRGGNELNFDVTPVRSSEDGRYRAGLWIKDSTAGIGTVTYIDADGARFAGLGHGICDVDTGELIEFSRGNVVNVAVSGIVKGRPGSPGELKGYFSSGKIGKILGNKECGVYGLLAELPIGLRDEAVPIALSDEIHEGEAEMLCTIDCLGVKRYKVNVSKIDRSGRSVKNFIVNVTDAELLEKTGGIVQGMSGSPIIQDGKLIGAVTHVLVNDPTKGYGIFIENMLDAAE